MTFSALASEVVFLLLFAADFSLFPDDLLAALLETSIEPDDVGALKTALLDFPPLGAVMGSSAADLPVLVGNGMEIDNCADLLDFPVTLDGFVAASVVDTGTVDVVVVSISIASHSQMVLISDGNTSHCGGGINPTIPIFCKMPHGIRPD